MGAEINAPLKAFPSSMSNIPLTVYVVDDDEGIRSSLTRALNKRGFTVETFDSARAFLDRYDEHGLGCLVLDHGMPGMTGLELQNHLNRLGCPLPIIFITGHGGVPESVQAIKAGAVDFLEKPFSQAVLIERIETALDLARAMAETRESARTARVRFDRLTAREHEIVLFMIANPAETSSKEVGANLGISPRTVDHHRARIFEKLGIKSVVELIALKQHAAR